MKSIKKTIHALVVAISISATPAAGGIPTAMKHKSNIKKSISTNASLLNTFHITSNNDLIKVIEFFETVNKELSSIIHTLKDAEGYTFGSKTGVTNREEAKKLQHKIQTIIKELKEIQEADEVENKIEKATKKVNSIWNIKRIIAKIKLEKEMIESLRKDGLNIQELEERFDSGLRNISFKIDQFKEQASKKELEKLEKELSHLPRDIPIARN